MREQLPTLIKVIFASLGGFLCEFYNFFHPAFLLIYVLLFFNVLDVVSAIRANIRLHRLDNKKYRKPRVRSSQLRRTAYKLGMQILLILGVYLAEIIIFPFLSIKITNWLVGVFIFTELISIIENELCGTKKKSLLFNLLRYVVAEKTSRYLKVDEDEIIKTIDTTFENSSIKFEKNKENDDK